jgi:RimJ/RimL family protein N-acetyltransferase/3-hydroxyisobutyrate dehydrogenase-like beta-hydroxyacid dehydrogenase
MGAAVGAALVSRGHDVAWASAGRSEATSRRAADAGLRDLGTVSALARRCDTIVSVCPPHAALDVARAVGYFRGTYVDANAVAPATARRIASTVQRLVDGGIVGAPPDPRLYLSGEAAEDVAALFAGSPIEPRVLGGAIGDASALKMAYAAWSKGTAAMLLAIRDVARAEGVEEALLREWAESVPGLEEQWERARRSAEVKGWRWVGEMEEIAATFAAAGLPSGFHAAAAEVYRRGSRPAAAGVRDTVSQSQVGDTVSQSQVGDTVSQGSGGLEVRPARPEDARAAAELFAAVAEERDGIATEPPVDVEARTEQFAASADGSLVAVADGALVGLLHVEQRRGVGEIGMLVDRSWRGRGVGTALVRAAIDRARADGLHKLSLEVFPHNAAGIALYRKCGFVDEGRRVKHYRRASGELWDAVVMGLPL